MPWINYDNMPYKKRLSNGERVVKNGYFCPNPDYQEDRTVYRGYHTFDSFGYQLKHIMSFDDEGKIIRTTK